MAGESNDTAVINLDLISDGVQQGIQQAISSLGDLTNKSKVSTKEIAEGAFLGELAMKALETAVELVKIGFEKMGEAITEASNKESAINSLNLAMSNAGQYSKEASEHLVDFAEGLQTSSKYSAISVIQAEALARNFAISTQETEKLTKAAVNLSAATGKDLNTAVQTLGMSLEGHLGRLQKMVPGMEKLTSQQLQLGGALDYVNARYGGSAANTITTFSGRMDMLRNSTSALMESFGKMVVDSPIINASIEYISKAFQAGAEYVAKFASAGNLDAFIMKVAALGHTVITYVVAPLEQAWNIGQQFVNVMHLGLQAIFESIVQVGNAIVQIFVGNFVNAIEGIGALVGKFSSSIGKQLTDAAISVKDGFLKPLDDFALATTETTKSLATSVNKDWEKMFDFSFSDKLDKGLSQIQTFFASASKQQQDFNNKSTADMKRYDTQLGQMLQSGLASSISKTMQTVGASLVQGGNAFANFGNVIMGIIGDLAIKMGENMIAQGVAILGLKTALQTMQPELAFAAGAALIVLGGALKALSGGSSSSSSSSASSSGGSASLPSSASSAISSPGSSSTTATQTTAQIVINGDFLNSRETANHLADILRKNSDTTNYAIVAQGKQY